MKKYIALLLTTSFCITSNVSAFAGKLEVFGTTKMNLWDVYLTENAKEKPDAISTATIDAVTQATYSIYDNKPVEIDTAVDLGLIADAKILKQNGIDNEMVNRIITIWEEGYRIPLLGEGKNSYETNPLTREVVRYTDGEGKTYDFSYGDIAGINPTKEGFTWEDYAKTVSTENNASAPYRAKYLLNNGNFGRRALVDETSAADPPRLSLDEAYSSQPEVKGKFIKLDFENNVDWANAVYAIKVNESGLIYGDLHLGYDYNDAGGDTTFLTGSGPADKSQILIRMNQKFRLGENKLTFMAKGYQDAEYTHTLSESLTEYPWLLQFTAVNETKQDAPLEDSTIMQGDVIRINATGGSYFNKFDRIYIDGKLLPAESVSDSSYLTYYKYGNNGKTLWVYTGDLTPGLHEIRLAKQRYNDLEYFLTVSTEGLKELPNLTLLDQNGESATQNFSIKGSPIVLKADNLEELKNWFAKMGDILYSGPSNEVNSITGAVLDENNQTISLNASSMQYWNKTGAHSLLIRSSGYPEFKLSVKRGNALPASTAITYCAEDGYVIVSSDYSYITLDNLKAIVINGVEYAPSLFEIKSSYGSPSTVTIPSEYFEANTQATVKVLSNNYMDFSDTLSIPAEHSKRKETPQMQGEKSKVIVNGTIIAVISTYAEEQDWKDKISKVTLKKTTETTGSGTNISLTKISKTEDGKLSINLSSSYLQTGAYIVSIEATGYRTASFPVELVNAVPGEVTYELNIDGSVSISVGGSSSTYVKNIAVKVDGQEVASSAITKATNAFTISKDSFSAKKIYQVLLTATGYMDQNIEIQTNVQDAPELALMGVVDISTKKMTVTFGENAAWREAITEVEFVRNNGSSVSAVLEGKATPGEITIYLGSMYSSDKYTLKITATGYRKAFLEIPVLNTVPTGITYELLLNGTEHEIKISLGNSSYANAITEIRVGGETLQKDQDFTIAGSVATIHGELPKGISQVNLIASNYPEHSIQIENLSVPSETITLPGVISTQADFVITSADGTWLNAISSITIGGTSLTSTKLKKEADKVTIAANDMKYLYGTGQSVKIAAEGYRSIVFSNATIYSKLASAYSCTIESAEEGLKIDLNETAGSSYYSVKKVFVNGNEVASTHIEMPSYKNNYTLLIKKEALEAYHGQSVSIKITNVSSYTQDISITVDITLTGESPQGIEGQSFAESLSEDEGFEGEINELIEEPKEEAVKKSKQSETEESSEHHEDSNTNNLLEESPKEIELS